MNQNGRKNDKYENKSDSGRHPHHRLDKRVVPLALDVHLRRIHEPPTGPGQRDLVENVHRCRFDFGETRTGNLPWQFDQLLQMDLIQGKGNNVNTLKSSPNPGAISSIRFAEQSRTHPLVLKRNKPTHVSLSTSLFHRLRAESVQHGREQRVCQMRVAH
jgi:hypothetical protein